MRKEIRASVIKKVAAAPADGPTDTAEKRVYQIVSAKSTRNFSVGNKN